MKGTLTFQYNYSAGLMGRETEVNPAVVLIHETSRRKHVVPTDLRIEGTWTGGGSDSIKLPDDLPEGRYRVFLQLDEPGGIKSEGHFFTVEL